MQMSLRSLRSLDVKEPKDEALVQEVINEKEKGEIRLDPNRIVLPSRKTDEIRTPEKEMEIQAELDKLVVPKSIPPVEASTSTSVPVNESVVVSKKFCDYCDAKGPVRHKKNCTRVKLPPSNV